MPVEYQKSYIPESDIKITLGALGSEELASFSFYNASTRGTSYPMRADKHTWQNSDGSHSSETYRNEIGPGFRRNFSIIVSHYQMGGGSFKNLNTMVSTQYEYLRLSKTSIRIKITIFRSVSTDGYITGGPVINTYDLESLN